MADWRERIIIDPKVLVGKPVIKGTRLAVEFVIDLLAQGWNEQEIIRNYPGITREDIQACLAYASETLKIESNCSGISLKNDKIAKNQKASENKRDGTNQATQRRRNPRHLPTRGRCNGGIGGQSDQGSASAERTLTGAGGSSGEEQPQQRKATLQ